MNLELALQWADYWWSGFKDALNWPTPMLVTYRVQPIWKRTLDCIKLNGLIFLCSILLFQYALDPLMKYLLDFSSLETESNSHIIGIVASLLNYTYSISYYVFYVYPVYVISFILNAIWYQEIADRAFQHQVGKGTFTPRPLGDVIADEIYRALLVAVYMIQASLIMLVPVVGPPIGFVLMCWLYSLYCFEYKWVNLGYDLRKRLRIFQTRWAYFFGFGTPFTGVCYMFPGVMSGGVFALLFPLFIIMANVSKPRPYQAAPAGSFMRSVPMMTLAERLVDPLIKWMEKAFWRRAAESMAGQQPLPSADE